jgi:NodT family efflux transporter outer membrane factor (OMF) lipoprotein
MPNKIFQLASRRFCLPALAAVVLSLGGCMVGPNFVKPKAKLNENWAEKDDPHAATQKTVSEQWWKSFNDPMLDQLIEQASRQNLSLQVEGLRILEARAQLGISIGQQYPQTQKLSRSATAVGLSHNAPNSAQVDHYYRDYQVGFDASWELDFWGKYRRGVEADAANLISTEADYDAALVSLMAEVAQTYVTIRTNEVLIDVARQNVALQEEGLRITESRFGNGATTELDVTQARALLESTKATIPQLQTNLHQAEHALSTLLGQPVGDIPALRAGRKGIPTAPSQVAVGVPAELLRRRPDIREAEFAAAAQCARIGVAKADLYPSFSLGGSIGAETSGGKGVHFNLFDAKSVFYSLGPSVDWTVLDYGRIKNNVRVQDAQFQESLVNYQNTVLNAQQEVEDALCAFLKAKEAAVAWQNSVEAAQRSVELSLAQYRDGAVYYQSVLDSQRSLLDQENSLAQTRSSIATNLIALYRALGGGWELRRNQPIVAESTQAEMRKRTDWGDLLPASAPKNTNAPPTTVPSLLPEKPEW